MAERIFIKESELSQEQLKTFKFLIDRGVLMKEKKYSGVPIWQKYFHASYNDIIQEFSFSTGAGRREQKWLIDIVWRKFEK